MDHSHCSINMTLLLSKSVHKEAKYYSLSHIKIYITIKLKNLEFAI